MAEQGTMGREAFSELKLVWCVPSGDWGLRPRGGQ